MRSFCSKSIDSVQRENIGLFSGIGISLTFCTIWAFTTIIVSTMEFYDEFDWTKSWRTGFLGHYCNKEDYFAFSKWNEYNWDIQFLVVSWFVF